MAIDKARIAKNTFFLYSRMLILMGISLFTVKIVLKALGAVDYGIYNVVGGVVFLFSFVYSTFTNAAQRFFSYEIGNKNADKLKKIFSLHIILFLWLSLGIVLLAETIGIWFINTQLVIPAERLCAANWVFQFSIFAFILQLLSVPYNALIISHEKMHAFAYISIVEGGCKFLVAILLLHSGGDKLIIYSILMFVISVIITFSYYIYCRMKFKESNYSFYWNKEQAFKIVTFSGWHFLGSVSSIFKGQGINILLNMFFNPVVNAARAIAFQVDGAIMSLSNNFFLATRPQVYMLYGAGKVHEMNDLIIQSTRYCFYLLLFFAMPLFLEASYILHLWLENVPDYTVLFLQLVIVCSLVDSTNSPAIACALATNKIRTFELVQGGLTIMNLPISYIFLKQGCTPQVTLYVSLFISLLILVIRTIVLNKLTGLSIIKYFRAVAGMFIVAALSFIFPFIVKLFSSDGSIVSFLLVGGSSCISFIICVWNLGLSKAERYKIGASIKSRINKRR